MDSLLLCVIDDDLIYHAIVQRILSQSDAVDDILTFMNGQDALDHFKSLENESLMPDMIFLDLNMPVMDGFEFLAEFTPMFPNLSKEVRIYVVTSSIDPEDQRKVKRYNEVQGFIVKPISRDDALGIVESMKQKVRDRSVGR